MKNKRFKKALSVFLSVLMLMSCWVWVAPTDSEAALADTSSLDAAISAYETKMNGTIYTNMKAAYEAYIDALEARDAYKYGGNTSIDIAAAATNLTNATNAMGTWSGTSYTQATPSFDGDNGSYTLGTTHQNILYTETVATGQKYTYTVGNLASALTNPKTVLVIDGVNTPKMPINYVGRADRNKNRYIYKLYPSNGTGVSSTYSATESSYFQMAEAWRGQGTTNDFAWIWSNGTNRGGWGPDNQQQSGKINQKNWTGGGDFSYYSGVMQVKASGFNNIATKIFVPYSDTGYSEVTGDESLQFYLLAGDSASDNNSLTISHGIAVVNYTYLQEQIKAAIGTGFSATPSYTQDYTDVLALFEAVERAQRFRIHHNSSGKTAAGVSTESALTQGYNYASVNAAVSAVATDMNTLINEFKTALGEVNADEVGYSNLRSEITTSEALIANEKYYTPTTWATFEAAYADAQSFMAATQTKYYTEADTAQAKYEALKAAREALTYITITYKYYDGTVAKTLSGSDKTAYIGMTAADLSSQAPTNTSIESVDDTNHYVYSWPSFANVTDSATYQETRGTQAHQLGDYIIDQDSTCTAVGSKHKECANCDYKTAAETIPVKAHTPGAAATCTAPQTCTVCGTELEAAKGHNYTSEITSAPTCTTEGVEKFTCSVCGDTYTEAISPTGHTPGAAATCEAAQTCTVCGAELAAQLAHTEEIIPAVPATCTTPGKTEGKKCSVCGTILVAQETTPTIDHNLGDWITDKEPTCVTPGSKHKKCANCAYTTTEAIPATGNHVYGDWAQYGDKHRRTCTVDVACAAYEEEAHNFNGALKQLGGNFHNYKCEKCEAYGVGSTLNIGEECFGEGTTYDQIVDNDSQHKEICKCGREQNGGHAYGGWAADPENTTDNQGKMSRTCTECNYKQTTSCTYTVTEKPATCTEDGYKTWECMDCGNGYSEILTASGHIEGEAVEENRTESSCTVAGSYDSVVYCSKCNAELDRDTVALPLAAHTEGEAVEENRKESSCTVAGSYDSVVYCSVCNEKLSSETVELPLAEHTEGEAVEENIKESTCTVAGSYDLVVYCSVCDEELSRDTIDLPLADHTEGEAVKENETASTCKVAGSYDSVVYCSVCDEELSRDTIDLPLADHTEGEAVKENETSSTCKVAGSYDSVVYCSKCNAELDRDTVALPLAAHTEGEAVEENRKESSCTVAGSYDSVVYCSVCDEELSRDTIDLPLADHTEGEAVKENETASTCKVAGSYDSVVYCSVCDEELSRDTIDLPLADHTASEAVKENETASTCKVAGSYDSVVYCSKCNAELNRDTIDLPLAEHNWGNASCDAPATCTVCGATTGDKLGHDWADTTYNFAADDSSCTAERACKRTGCGETETATAEITSAVKTPATCIEKGTTTYTATFEEAWATEQTKDVTDIPAKGHDYDETKSEANLTRPELVDGAWKDGYYTYTCKNDPNHTTTESVSRATYTDYDKAVEELNKLLNNDKITDAAKKDITDALANNVADNLITTEQDKVNDATDALNEILNKIANDTTGAYEKPDYSEAEQAIKDAENIPDLENTDKEALEKLKNDLQEIKDKKNPDANAKDDQDDIDAIRDEVKDIITKYEKCKHIGTSRRVVSHLNGTHSIQCVVCDETIETVSCTYTVTEVGATCQSVGYTLHECDVCSYSYKDNENGPTDHDWSQWYINEGTCKDVSTQTRYCDSEGCFAQETVIRTDSNGNKIYGAHTLVVVNGKPATCTTDGHTDYSRCIICDQVTESEVLPATGHSDNNHNGNCDRCNYLMNASGKCGCFCHNDSFFGKLLYRFVNFFWKLFKINKNCECGSNHW